MSLTILVEYVRDKLNISELEAIKKIKLVPDKFNFSFTKTYVEQKILEPDKKHEFNIIIEALVKYNFLNINYSYKCNLYGQNSTSSMVKCEFCGKDILESEEHHINDILYRMPREKWNEILRHLEEEKLKNYIRAGFKPNYEELLSCKNDIVPFIGAGLSVPLNYPSWKELLEIFKNKLEEEYIKQAYQAYIDRGDYLGAFDYLKNNTVFNTEKRIKQEIVKIFKEANPKNPFEEPNNYIDLYELNNNFILTTNYDNIFTELATKFGTFALPLILSEIQDHHNLNREKKQRVIHLHGNIDKPDTMIVTKTDYENLYNNPETTEKLMSIMSSKSLLFLGFSFKDEFFVNLYTTITQKVGGQHFIIAPDIDMKKAKEFAEIGLIAISLNVKKDNNGNYCSKDYVEAIKTVLNSIKVN